VRVTAPRFVIRLGSEYPIGLRKAELVQVTSNRAVWMIQSTGDPLPFDRLTFVAGQNDELSVIGRGIRSDLLLTTPNGSESFVILPNVDYELRIWDETSGPTKTLLRFTQ
jgi:hypothetical protein